MTSWDEAVAHAKAVIEREERCPDGCRHIVCDLPPDAVFKPGEVVTFKVVAGGE